MVWTSRLLMKKLEQKVIKRLLEKEDPLILEIGAHIGMDTKKFLQEFKDLKIYCFEPDPRCIKIFKESIKDNRCVLIEAAVSNYDGKATLCLSYSSKYSFLIDFNLLNMHNVVNLARHIKHIFVFWDKGYIDSLGQSSIKKSISKSEDYPWLIFKEKIEVKTIKIDTWVKENNIHYIDFIWSDVQGAEKDIIEGATDALKITKYLSIEYGETSPYPDAMTRDETIELLKEHNFGLIPEYSNKGKIGNLLFRNKKF